MKIGIVSNINPNELRGYLYNNQVISITNSMSSSVQALVSGLITLGHRVIVFSPASSRLTKGKHYVVLEGDNLKIYLIRVLPKIDYLIRHIYLPHSIARLIKKELINLDVIHSHWTYECSTATIKFVTQKPTFCSVRDWWPVQYEYFKNAGIHQRILWGIAKRKMFYKTMNEERITFIANSEYTRNQILETYPEKNVPIIPNPIKAKYIIKNKNYRFNEVFVSIANSLFEKRKNIEMLLKGFYLYHLKHPYSRLLLIGDYSQNDSTYVRWKINGYLAGVEFCGILPHDQVLRKLDETSIMIHPSLEETFGNILLEGMARRILVVGGENSGAVPSVLGAGKYGVLCNVRNEQSIYTTLEEIASDSFNAAKIVDGATDYICSELTDIAVAKKHIELYTNSDNN